MIKFLWGLLQKNRKVYVFLINKDLGREIGPVKNFSFEKVVGGLFHITGEKKLVEERGYEELNKLEDCVSGLVLQKVRWSDDDRLSCFYKEKCDGR